MSACEWARRATVLMVATLVNGCGSVDPAPAVEVDADVDVDIDAGPAPGEVLWARRVGGAGNDRGTTTVVDDDGSIVVGGVFQDELDPDTGEPLISAGASDVFLMRLDPDGTPRDAARYGGPAEDGDPRLAPLAFGELAVATTFTTSTDLGDHTSSGPNDGLIAVLSPAFARIWSTPIGGPSIDGALAAAADADGDVLFGGTFAYSMTIGDDGLVGDGLDGWVARFAPGGAARWADRQGGGTGAGGANQQVTGLAVDANGNTYVAGFTMDAVEIGGETYASNGKRDVFVIKYDRDGAVDWVRMVRSDAGYVRASVVVDAAGAVCVGLPIGEDSVVRRYLPDGTASWEMVLPFAIEDVNASAFGIEVAGRFSGPISVGGAPLVSRGGTDVVVARLDTLDGSVVLARAMGGTGNDAALAIAPTDDGDLIVTGAFSGTMQLGGGVLEAAGAEDGFIVALAAAP